ncbi:MAG TPA: hypothetical protein VG734_18050 [Lacunisphaera sp.]|nr:hypothetical protein [Lacunisphaera sp.]
MKASLFRWAEAQGADSVNKQRRLFKVSKSLLSYWRHSEKLPSLQRLIELCLSLGLPVMDVCQGELDPTEEPRPLRGPISKAWQHRRITCARRKEIETELREFATSPFPPPLKQIATKLGVDLSTLEGIDAKACAKISASGKSHKSIVTAVRFERFRQHVDLRISRAKQTGEGLTIKTLGDTLPNPGIMRSPKCREYVAQMLKKARRDQCDPRG